MFIGIVADDLTGAADSVAPFATRGLDCDVQFHGGKLPPDAEGSDARAWSTGTRDLPADREAGAAIRRLTRAVTRRLQRFAPTLFFKKIDSTLRGHLRMELDAIRIELPNRLAVVCPAFPVNGRTVREGDLYVNGERSVNLRAAFEMVGEALAVDLSLRVLRDPATRLSDRAREWQSRGIHTVFCDAESDQDLSLIADAILRCEKLCLPVGSAGLSAAIARRLPTLDLTGRRPNAVLEELARGRCLVMVGSLHGASRRQAACLAERAGISPVEVRAVTDYFSAGEEIARQFEAGRLIVLVKTPDQMKEPGRMNRLPGFMVPLSLFAAYQNMGLVATGGHTAENTLATFLGCNGVKVLEELEPGVVCGRLLGGGLPSADLTGRPIVLKAGGFGSDETLARCVGLG